MIAQCPHALPRTQTRKRSTNVRTYNTNPATKLRPVSSTPAPALRLPAPFEVVEALGDGEPAPEAEADGFVVAEPEAAGAPALDAVTPIAFCWKAENDLSAVGLMANTIPIAQWLYTA